MNIACTRTYMLEKILPAVNQYSENISGFNPDEWIDDERNVALINSIGDIALFERESTHLVNGHYFFWSRGRKAVEAGKEFLEEIFEGDYGVEIIRGLTPITHLGARWLNRQLGFTYTGIVRTSSGPCAINLLSKEDYINNKEK